jgi:hypothetical protein
MTQPDGGASQGAGPAPGSQETTGEERRQRKERVLHARISEQLADDIRRLADDLRVPVSNLVRNVLEEAFSAAQRVSVDLGDVLEDVVAEAERASERYQRYRARREARRERAAAPEAGSATPPAAEAEPPADPFARVAAWQAVVIHSPQRCAKTGRTLAAGERAYLGVGTTPPLFVAEDALPLGAPD